MKTSGSAHGPMLRGLIVVLLAQVVQINARSQLRTSVISATKKAGAYALSPVAPQDSSMSLIIRGNRTWRIEEEPAEGETDLPDWNFNPVSNIHDTMKEEIEESGVEEEAIAKFVVVPVCLSFMLVFIVSNLIERLQLSWLPESAVVILIGSLLGHFMESTIGYISFFNSDRVFNASCSTILNLLLLPMIIFASGWSLRTKDFLSQFGYIMSFAIIGSLLSFLTVGGLIHWTGSMGLHSITAVRTALAYAALIAATDPVATLATYSKLKVDPLLNILVWGDSCFNDAVAIVLFKVLNSNDIMGEPGAGTSPTFEQLARRISYGIFYNFGGSVVVGIALAMVYILVLRFFDMRHAPKLEILYLFISGYGTFAIAEVIGLSGIIATMFNSILLGVYARPHLSPEGSLLASFFINQIATLMDTSVFLLTGLAAVSLGAKGWIFGLWSMLFCLIGRAAGVFPVGLGSNLIKIIRGSCSTIDERKWHLIDMKLLFMMWHAGLRGAIALVLCMQLGDWVDKLDGAGTRRLLQVATYLVIGVFLLAFGGSTEFCLKKLGIQMGQDSSPEEMFEAESTWVHKVFVDFIDKRIMVPLLVGEQHLADAITAEQKEMDVQEVLASVTLTSAKKGKPSESET